MLFGYKFPWEKRAEAREQAEFRAREIARSIRREQIRRSLAERAERMPDILVKKADGVGWSATILPGIPCAPEEHYQEPGIKKV